MQINEYLRSELVRAGFAGVDVQKTPLGVRITLRTSRPGLVIGKFFRQFDALAKRWEAHSRDYGRSSRSIWAGKLIST